MLRVYAFYHLNLMFSSIDERQRADVIARCYWPILRMAERLRRPIGIEATGFTLETIERLDPAWIEQARKLAESGLIEPIGSGYSQMIGPLMPSELVRWNLKLGNKVYERIWGNRPRLALINEQAYSAGILAHYVEAGYEAILMDWDMCAHVHPEWPEEWRYHPQRAQGVGATLPVIWTSTHAFQSLQRLAHGDIALEDYAERILARADGTGRTLSLYNNDAECFDFRPGQFKTEAAISNQSEWAVIESAFARLLEDQAIEWIAPSDALKVEGPFAGNTIPLESAAFPIPVKKQLKYNASRWAVTGRASFELNRRCRSAARQLAAAGSTQEDLWQQLCWLGSSDLRTHITEQRFQESLAFLSQFERSLPSAPQKPVRSVAREHASVRVDERHIELLGGAIGVRLNSHKGLAIEEIALGPQGTRRAFAGTVPYGAYDDLIHAFDWYSGTLIAEFVGRPKITDLARVTPRITENAGVITLVADFQTPLGDLTKTITFDGSSLAFRYELDWPASERGTLRIANLTLLPDAVDAETLFFETNNGGAAERNALKGQTFDQGAPVSFLVSASSGAGMTEGRVRIGDSRNSLTLTADDDCNAYLALITHRLVKGKVFCRATLSASELDDTRKPWAGAPRPLVLGYRITAG